MSGPRRCHWGKTMAGDALIIGNSRNFSCCARQLRSQPMLANAIWRIQRHSGVSLLYRSPDS